MHTYMSLQGVCVSSQGFLFGVCLEYFCLEDFIRGGFCPSPLLSEYIHYNRKLNITFNFRFHMYEFFLKCDVICSWTPPLSQTVTPSRTPSPSSVTYFMDNLGYVKCRPIYVASIPAFYYVSTSTGRRLPLLRN